MVIKVGINGFGRIGRVISRVCLEHPDLQLSAINDPAIRVEYISYLIKFDSTHGKLKGNVTHTDDELSVDGINIKVFHEKLPKNIPWHTAGVQYVVEASGMFTNFEKSSGHLICNGVKRVIVTAPSGDIPMVILGVNENNLAPEQKVMSCASSTLYCLAPIIKVLEDHFGVAEGFITSIHAMTPSLKPLDGLCLKGKHWRDHRSIHQNIIPATTGACKALGKIMPQVKDKLSGLAFRVPIVNVSVLDLTIRLNSNTTISEIVKSVEKASSSSMRNVIKISNEEAVSSDFIGESHSCIFDVDSSIQLKPNFFKIICWYENEYSYAWRVADTILFSEKQFLNLEMFSKIRCVRPRSWRKQDVMQQTENYKKEISTSCCYQKSEHNVKLKLKRVNNLFCQSQQKPLPTGIIPSLANLSARKNVLFKIWNNTSEINKPVLKQNKETESCLTEATQEPKKEQDLKALTRLENVKREFSKMVNMTEDLLKKTQNKPPEGHVNTSKNKFTNKKDSKFWTEDRLFMGTERFMEMKMNDKGGDCKTVSLQNKKVKVIEKDIVDVNSVEISSPQDNFKEHIANTINTLIGGLTQNTKVHCLANDLEIKPDDDKIGINDEQIEENIDIEAPTVVNQDYFCNTQVNEISRAKQLLIDSTLNLNHKMNLFKKIKKSDNSNVKIIVNELRKRHIVLDNPFVAETISNENVFIDLTDENVKSKKNMTLDRQLFEELESQPENVAIVSKNNSGCESPENTTTTISNRNENGQDIYDKLDSDSATDSDNSYEFSERKSQVVLISDLTNSFEDLAQLDKICKIIEISDELSNELFSALENKEGMQLKNKRWSFRDLCERIHLDAFCNKVFGRMSL